MCTRILYEAPSTETKNYLIARSLDWYEDTHTNLWAFPRGMKRDGGVGPESIKWTSKYASLIADIYAAVSCDGINDVGLVGNALYLAESDYGDEDQPDKPKISIGAWLQYILDNYCTVAEAVCELEKEPFVIIAPKLPDGNNATGHVSIADPSGDSAIFEYIEGHLVIHHDSKYTVMTNSPPFDDQLSINTYWNDVGGLQMLPGTHRASDRFARVSWNLNATEKVSDLQMATAIAFSIIRHISVPLTISDPDRPNIASTTWRTVADIENQRYYFESAFTPSVFWVDLKTLDLKNIKESMKLDLSDNRILSGEVSDKFVCHDPFDWLS